MSFLSDTISAILKAIAGRPLTQDELDIALDKLSRNSAERLDWRNSIVDLMKLTGQDSSLEHRMSLAKELGYRGKLNGSAAMNIFLHAEAMHKLESSLKSPVG